MDSFKDLDIEVHVYPKANRDEIIIYTQVNLYVYILIRYSSIGNEWKKTYDLFEVHKLS